MNETSCKFNKAWIGLCGKEPVNERGMCPEHAVKKCVSCGKPATRECSHTGQFVCGYSLCDDCRHGIPPAGEEGYFGCAGGHVSKKVYKKQHEERYSKKE